MYERTGMQGVPFPFYEIPPNGTPVRTLDFLPAMGILLENMYGLAATSHAGSLSSELAYQELTQALFILKEYAQATLTLFTRWEQDRHPGPTIDEDEDGLGETQAWRPQDAG